MSKNQNYILFYSKQCQYSSEFLNELYKNVDLFKKFIKVDVNDKSIKLPTYIKSVPTILVPGNYGKTTILTGNDVFSWLEMIKNSSNNQQGNNQQGNNQGGIADYDPFGMAGFSDGFAYLNDNAAPMDKSFEFINGNVVNSNLGVTLPSDDALDGDKLKNEAAERAMKELEASRDRELPIQPPRQ